MNIIYSFKGHNLQKFINIDHIPTAVVSSGPIGIDEENQGEEEEEKREMS